jgi:hypothetical protein
VVHYEEASIMSEQLDALKEMSDAVLKQNWEKVKSYLTDDLMYKMGSEEPKYGKEAPTNALQWLFKNAAMLEGEDVKKIWEEPGIITVEMDANYRRLKDNKLIKIPCVDVYRMRGNQVYEWRVYTDGRPLFEGLHG